MDIIPFHGDITATDADVIVLSIASDLQLGPHARAVNEASGGVIQRLIDCQEITGKDLESTLVLAPSGITVTHLVIVGLDDRNTLGVGRAFRGAACATRAFSHKERKRALFALDHISDDGDLAEAAIAGAFVGSHGQDLYRAKKKRFAPQLTMWTVGSEDICQRGRVIGQSINLTRQMVNQPPQDMYPESFAAEAISVANEVGLEIEIWDENKLREERCEALLAVSRGSSRPPRLVIAKHQGADANDPFLALVGKGVTFDSGGLSLKPTEGMKDMKCDMAGAATVLGALRAIAELELPVNVMGIMGLVENMVGPGSYKLGDVLTARNGRTIEVLNTDAEGRLVLADALTVAVDLGAAKIIDLATLTGACMVALGTDVAGVMTNQEAWCRQVMEAANHCGEPVWQLPMFPEYGKLIQSEVADIKNTGEGRWGGAITAAKLLEEFVAEVPWVHIDIAGPSFLDKPKPWVDAGGSGVMVRTLIDVVRKWEEN